MEAGNRTKLTAQKIKAISKPGLYGDGATLYLKVSPGGTKSWIQRLSIRGKQTDIGLGGFPVVTLAEAREAAFENRRLVQRGGDPLAEKRKAAMPTFQEAAERFRDTKRIVWRGGKTAKKWDCVLGKHAYPIIGRRPVDKVVKADLLRILTPIWTKTPDVARDLSQYLEQTFAWCEAFGYIEKNPAPRKVLKILLPERPASAKTGYRHMPYSEVPDVLRKVEAYAGKAASLCFRFQVFTAVRPGEARGATWSEIDLEARSWTIPAVRMKMKSGHVVPLSAPALDVLKQAHVLGDGSGLIFPSPDKQGCVLSDGTITKMLKAVGAHAKATPHGFRKSFRTWAEERTSADFAVKQMALAHVVGNEVERTYQRSNLLEKRRRLMDQWEAFLTGESAKVVTIGAGR